MKNFIKNYPLHILFFPAFSVLMMAANNVGQIDLIVILRPLIVSTLLSLGIFFLSSTILNDRHRAGTLSFIITFFILTYGHFYTLMQDRIIGNWVIGTHFYTLLLLGLVCILFIYLLVVKRKNIRNFTQILNILTLVLTGFQVGTIGVYKVKAEILPEEETQVQNETFLHVDPERMPDVYFIILDKYGRSDAIKSLYNYDNSDFIAALKGLGFWVADCSRSNYDFTVMSMSSQLNMAYIEDLTDNPNLKTTSALIRNNKVHQAFDDLGYTTIAFDTGFTWGNMKHFDHYFDQFQKNMDFWRFNPFTTLYLRSTIGVFFFEAEVDLGKQLTLTVLEQKAQRTRLILETLPKIPHLPGQKFVHAHIITPHPPYLFNADGSLNPDAEETKAAEGYPAQLAFIEPRIIHVFEEILENSEKPPIIILQGDHGFGKKYATSNLLALYLPEKDDGSLDKHMTLVNVFPLVFNSYFGAEMDYLPDLSYAHTTDWYESVLIEEWNPACKTD